MTILDGRKLSQKIREDVKKDVEKLKNEKGLVPGLAVLLVGDDPASHTYVNMKSKACKEVGVYSIIHEMPSSISEEEVLSIIEKINHNEFIDGILVQLPLPDHVDTTKVIDAIDVNKDVDGFHPYNVGQLVTNKEGYVPCTPLGVMNLLAEYNIDVKGMNAVVVGASDIVGKPMASLLLNAGATVDICHIHTRDLKEHTLKADIVLVGVGKPDLITADIVKDDVIIVDIGTTKVGDKIVGDVNYEGVSKKATFITPVPGGVGPMTIATLLENTVKACKKNRG
ncbi:MAG: bifunctional methylenetetrahydrofolate dehydrogenase/methenyltetrahydrofolate cyclohydrolase FolD [Campylobacterales bacterium]|nr:bifunctional methylenetetrahydrofolate dehydrogenase/methenyltetrahydrofolate cyclohydrolase FolD [Campylobacterales bacterium]